MQLFIYIHIFLFYISRKENTFIQVYKLFQYNQVQNKARNLPISSCKIVTVVITWIWRTNRLTCFCNKRCWRREWCCGLITSWNQISMWSWCASVLTSMFSFIMPCRSSSSGWLIFLQHEGSVDIHVENSSISGLNSRSPSYAISSFSTSFAVREGESSVNSGEVNKVLVVAKICSFWEGEILTATKSWESYFKMMIFKSILLVDGSFITQGLVSEVLTTPKYIDIYFNDLNRKTTYKNTLLKQICANQKKTKSKQWVAKLKDTPQL